MTGDSQENKGIAAGNDEPRLRLKPDTPASSFFNGAWWPRSSDLAAELPALFESIADRLGDVAMVGYHCSSWTTPVPAQLQIDEVMVQLQGYLSDGPDAVMLIGRDGRRIALRVIAPGAALFVRIALRVIAPGAAEALAQDELEATSWDTGGAGQSNSKAEQVVARSVVEVAAQLALHEGHDDSERTAEIAQWCEDAAKQFATAPVQTFVPILVHHIVSNRMTTRQATP